VVYFYIISSSYNFEILNIGVNQSNNLIYTCVNVGLEIRKQVDKQFSPGECTTDLTIIFVIL